MSAEELVRELQERNKPYEPLNVIDIQLKPKVTISFHFKYVYCILFKNTFFVQLGPLSHAVNGGGGFY